MGHYEVAQMVRRNYGDRVRAVLWANVGQVGSGISFHVEIRRRRQLEDHQNASDGEKATVAEMTKFPLSMSYGVKVVKNKEDFLRRYNEIFKGEANAVQCFATGQPRKESARRQEVYCPFKETPNEWENAPIRFVFEWTKGGWKFVALDNINE